MVPRLATLAPLPRTRARATLPKLPSPISLITSNLSSNADKVCDPGRELLVAARAAGIAVEVLPGPVAYVTAAVLSGFDLNELSFDGFQVPV